MSILELLGESEQFFTPVQRHMLDGLLGQDAASGMALSTWASMVDIDDIDAASYRLIPALYARAGAIPMLQQIHGRMKGIYRYYFYRNNKFLGRIEQVFSALTAAGIDFIVFKGISILLQYHNSAAGRSSADCDILIRLRDKALAETVLTGCGLNYCYDAERKLSDQHSHDFVDAAGNGFDLHWYALLECCDDGIDDGLWSRSRHIAWKDQRLRVLAPEDELLVAAMNGIREIDNSRADWLYDAWLILKAVPAFDWRLFYRQVQCRRLQQPFLTAFALLQRFVPHFPDRVVRKMFLPELKQAAWTLVAENRGFALDDETDRELTALLAPASRVQRLSGAVLGTDFRGRVAQSGDVVRYLHYEADGDGSVRKLYLHRDVLSYLRDIFDVIDPPALQAAGNLARRLDEVAFNLPPGVLRLPQQARLRKHEATVKTISRGLSFLGPGSSAMAVEIVLTNDSTWPWHMFFGSEKRFGLTYHLFAADGSLLCWEMPRNYFLKPRPGQVAMLLPGDSLRLALEISCPLTPGQYEARLDIVQELVAWFDSGQDFPSLRIDVP